MCITFGLRHLIPERDHSNRLQPTASSNRLQPTASSNRISDPPPITRQSRILLAVASLSVGVVAVLALLIIVRSSLDSGVFRHRKETSKSLKACGKPWIVGGEIVVLSILVACHFLIPVFLWLGFYKAVSVSVKVHRFAAPILCYLFAFQVVYCVASVWLMCAAFWITCELSLLFLFFYQVLKKQKTHISDVDVVNVDSSNDLRKPGHSILRKPRNTSGNNSKFDTFENNSHSNSLRNTSGNNFKSDTIDSHSNSLRNTSGTNFKSDKIENNSHSNSLQNTSRNNSKSDSIDSHSNGLQSTSGHNSKSTHRDGSSKFNERNSQVNSSVLMVSVLKQQFLPKSAKSVTYVWERGNEA